MPRPILLLALLSVPAPAQATAQDNAPDAGPLLAFTEVRLEGQDRVDVLRVVELEGPRGYELHRGEHGARVLRRLDRDRLLLQLPAPERLVVADLAAGSQRELARGHPELVAVRSGDVLYLQAPGRTGHLFSVPWREPGAPVRRSDHAFWRVPLVAGNLAFGFDFEETAVHVVSLTSARTRTVWTAPRGQSGLRLALSPNGQRLAIGAVDARQRGVLHVVDVATGDPVRRFDDLPVHVSMISSSTPTLEVAFADDEHVICSESRGDPRGLHGAFVHVTRSVRTGEVTDEAPYAPLGLQHRAPAPPLPEPRYVIERDAKVARLLEAGSAEVLASIDRAREQYEDLIVSRPDGRYGAARLGDRREHLTLFAPGREPRRLGSAWAHGLTWLPAAR